MAINALIRRQENGIEDTERKIAHLLDYCATNHGPTISYKQSDMQLYIYSDAYYLL